MAVNVTPQSGLGVNRDGLTSCEDAILIQLVIAGRKEYFSLLVERHLTAVKNTVRSLVSNDADMEDLMQEVLFTVWRHLASFRAESNLRTWMIRVAINQALQSYRRNKYRMSCRPIEDSPELVSSMDRPDQLLLRAEARAAIHGAIAGLPKKYREVVMLRDLRGLSAEESAEHLEISAFAIKSRLFRARRMLSRRLSRFRQCESRRNEAR